VVDRANQVWAADITFDAYGEPNGVGFVHLASVVNWFSLRVPAWRLSITLETEFCLGRCGRRLLQEHAIAISMDGRGAWRDNVFVEGLRRSVKSEDENLRAQDSVSDAPASLGRHLDFHNGRRPNSSLGARTPEQAYLDHLP